MAIGLPTILAATALSLAFAGSASAQATYTADDVVRHFVAGADLGQDRAVCIVTPTNPCKTEPKPSAPPTGFNLNVPFELNSAELTTQARDQLDQFATAATDRRLRAAKFHIDGHTDGRGGEELNQDLSERRAQSVVSYLVAKGVQPDRLLARGYGETKPIIENPLADANRRVEASATFN